MRWIREEPPIDRCDESTREDDVMDGWISLDNHNRSGPAQNKKNLILWWFFWREQSCELGVLTNRRQQRNLTWLFFSSKFIFVGTIPSAGRKMTRCPESPTGNEFISEKVTTTYTRWRCNWWDTQSWRKLEVLTSTACQPRFDSLQDSLDFSQCQGKYPAGNYIWEQDGHKMSVKWRSK